MVRPDSSGVEIEQDSVKLTTRSIETWISSINADPTVIEELSRRSSFVFRLAA